MRIFSLVCLFAFISCNTPKNTVSTASAFPSSPVYIYKTKQDYFKKVPVRLSEDKSKIVSYPAPSDLFFDGNFHRCGAGFIGQRGLDDLLF